MYSLSSETRTGTHSLWVSRLLEELGHEVIVAHAGNALPADPNDYFQLGNYKSLRN